VIFRRTVAIPWDDLDVQACQKDGQPDWSTLTVTGPTRRRGSGGQSCLEWTVAVQCRPAADGASPAPPTPLIPAEARTHH
jgi:hypothetical protein